MFFEFLTFLFASALAGLFLANQIFAFRQKQMAKKIRSTLSGETPPQETYKFPLGWYVPPNLKFASLTSQRAERYRKWGLFVTSYLVTPICTIFDPRLIAAVHNKTEENFIRRHHGFFGRLVGPSILGVSGEDWKRQQRILQKAFITGNISSFVPDMIKSILSKQSKIEFAVQNQKPLQLDTFFREITCAIIVRTAFASDTALTSQIGEILARAQGEIRWPLWRLVPFYSRLTFIPSVRQANEDLKTLETIARTILNERRAQKTSAEANSTNKTKYLIDLLNSAQDDESKTFLTDEEIIHNAFTFFLAGTNTTGGLLTWVCHHLVCHPEVYEKVQKEIDEVIPADVTKISVQDVNRLSYLSMVINETLRLTPPVWRAGDRHFVNDAQIGEWKCEKGASFSVNIYQVHHSPDLYPNPEKFDPDRWGSSKSSESSSASDDVELTPEQRERKIIETYKFVPFGAGRRVCIGKYFALLEAKVVLSIILRLYRFRIPPDQVNSFPKKILATLNVIDPVGSVDLLVGSRIAQ